MTTTTTGIKEVSDTERPAPVSLMAMIYRAMDELEHEEQHAVVVAPRLRTVFETTGGGINIPMEFTPRKNGNGALRFTLTKSQIKFIARHIHERWVKRAVRQDFWQCYACGWTPFPVVVRADENLPVFKEAAGKQVPVTTRPAIEDTAYAWFANQHYETRQWLVDISEQMTLSVVQELERGMDESARDERKEQRKPDRKRLDKMIEKNRPLGADEKDKIRTKTFNPKSNPKRLKKW